MVSTEMETIFFVAEGRMGMIRGGDVVMLPAEGGPEAEVKGISAADGKLYYSRLEMETGCVYAKPAAQPGGPPDEAVLRCREMPIYEIGGREGAMAAVTSRGVDGVRRQIALFTLPRGYYTLIADGDEVAESPSWGRDGSLLYFTTRACRRDVNGRVTGYEPRAVMAYDPAAHECVRLFASPDYDYCAPREGRSGAYYFVRRPYRELDNRLSRRLVRLLGYLAGRLRGGKKGKEALPAPPKAPVAAPQGRDELPEVAPRSWELMRAKRHSAPAVVKKGVLAFDLLEDGCIVYSDGRQVLKIYRDGKEKVLAEVPKVTALCAVDAVELG